MRSFIRANGLLIAFILVTSIAIYLRVSRTGAAFASRLFTSPTALHSSGTLPSQHSVSGSIENYPDLMVILRFDTPPSDSLLAAINRYKINHAKRHQAYMSDVSRDSLSGQYILGCDYQATPYNESIIQELTDSLYAVSGGQLKSIHFE